MSGAGDATRRSPSPASTSVTVAGEIGTGAAPAARDGDSVTHPAVVAELAPASSSDPDEHPATSTDIAVTTAHEETTDRNTRRCEDTGSQRIRRVVDNDAVDDQPLTDSGNADPHGADSPDADPDQVRSDGSTPGRRFSKVTAAVLGVALVVIGLDLLTKTIAVATLDPQRPVEIIGDVVTLRLVRNSGAAFSLASGYTWVLTIIALVVVAVIIRYSSRLKSWGWAIGLALVLGGAIGNLIDRIFRAPAPLQGHVVDFVSVGWFPVFNVADSAVVCGAILLVALSALGFDYDGSRTGWAARRDRHTAEHTDTHSDNDEDGGTTHA